MGHSQAEKAENRQRILAEAARRLREAGMDALNVSGLMHGVGLTHGGFYGHFVSRDDLMTQALKQALVEGEAKARETHKGSGPRGFVEIVRAYLSRTHRNSRSTGCAIGALGQEVARADLSSRQLMEEHIEMILDRLARLLGDKDEDRAMVAFSAMVGAVTLSRVMTDPARADDVLRATREHLLAFAHEPAAA